MLNSKELSLRIQETEEILKQAPQKALKNALVLQSELPDSESAQLLVARCQRFCDQLDASQKTLQAILDKTPLNVLARMELATLLNQKKQHHEAINLLVETTRLVPEYHEVWAVLSQHLLQIGDKAAATHATAQHDMIKKFNVQLARAQEHFSGERYEEAEAICRQLLKQVPTEFRTLKLLAQIATRFTHYEVAASMLEYCTLQKPNDVQIGIEHAKVLLLARQYRKALDECQRLFELAPDSIRVTSIAAEAQVGLGDYLNALDSYAKLIPAHPRKELCLLKNGTVLRIMGRTEEALENFRAAIKIDPTLGEAYWSLANLHNNALSDADIAAITAQLDGSAITPEERMFLNFSMGKAMQDRQEYSKSFNYYKIANDAGLDLNPIKDTQQDQKLMAFFTADYFERLKNPDSTATAPIFIVGLRRSGATLLEQILTSHTQVDGTTEIAEISAIARQLSPQENRSTMDYTGALSKMDINALKQLAHRYLETVAPMRQGALHFVDKTSENFRHIGLIKSIFPNAKIIEVRRDPVACGLSLYTQYFPEGHEYASDLAAIGQYYNEYIKLMTHWHHVLPEQILTINYEDLVSDLSSTVHSILAYCNLDFEGACLEYYKNPRPVAAISSEQVRQPIYQEGLSHWKNYESFLKPLQSALGQ